MALTVTTDLTNIDLGVDSASWIDIGGGASAAAETDSFIQGTACVSRAISNSVKGFWFDIGAGNELDFSSGGTEENELIYMWIKCPIPALLSTISTSAGGLHIRLGVSTTNYANFNVGGSDFGIEENRGWILFIIDPTLTPSSTGGTGYNPATETLRYFGAVIDVTAAAKGQTLFIDAIRHGRGELRATGTTTTTGQALQEMSDADWGTINNRYGILEERSGVIFCHGKLIIGDDAGTLATTFTAEDSQIYWETPMYYNGTNRVKSIPDTDEDDLNYFGVNIVGNTTGATTCSFGVVVGSDAGRSGPLFQVQENAELTTVARQEWRMTRDANVNDLDMYGTVFRGCERPDESSAIDLTNADINDKCYSCTFDSCGRLYFAAMEVRNMTVLNSIVGTADGSLLWNNVTNVQDSAFFNPAFHSIVIEDSTGTPFTWTKLIFGTTALALRYEDTENITVNIVDGTTGLTSEDVSGTTTFSSSVNIDITVVDNTATAIQNARVGVYDAADNTEYMNELSNASGFASEAYTGATPKSVVLRVRKNSAADNPRYTSFSSPATITTTGLVATVLLTEDINAL